MSSDSSAIDIAIIGGGAAGLMAAIQAAQAAPELNIAIFDGARKLGAKILVAGGGRCNVTHTQVSQHDFAGSSPNSIRKILGRFTEQQTVNFFQGHGVELKTEETGKLFPVSDRAGDILNALLNDVRRRKVQIHTQHRVENIEKPSDLFRITTSTGQSFQAKKLILATGGKSLPKTGSDGLGFRFATNLGHQLTEDIFPALVPLCLPENHIITQLSGISKRVTLSVLSSSGKVLKSFTNDMLCTHFGISGPAALDISRYYLQEERKQQHPQLHLNWLPDLPIEQLETQLLNHKDKRQISTILNQHLPTRLVPILCESTGIDITYKTAQISREKRQQLLKLIYAMPLPITSNRGYKFAEVTAGGVPLKQCYLHSLESRICNGLYFCGEILDVDGRIGGFNFQWAWSSGFTCGTAAAKSVLES